MYVHISPYAFIVSMFTVNMWAFVSDLVRLHVCVYQSKQKNEAYTEQTKLETQKLSLIKKRTSWIGCGH